MVSNKGTSASISRVADIKKTPGSSTQVIMSRKLKKTKKNGRDSLARDMEMVTLSPSAEWPSRRLGAWGVVLREEHHVPVAALAVALRLEVRHRGERQVQQAPLARIHRCKMERHARLAHLLRGDLRCHAQFVLPDFLLIARVEA